MGSPAIFSGRRAKLLTADGVLNSDGSINDFDGVRNYILNGHAEVNTLGWATYADAAGTRPVDGTGGTPTVTFTRATTSPLDGSGSFIFTKDAANRQGEGASYDFTIQSTDVAKVLRIQADYIVNSGTFVAGSTTTDSDLIFYIYDVTNAVLIEPSSIKLFSNSSTIGDQFSAYFQTSSNSTSYRLIIHCASTSASAYSVKFDNVSVSPSQYVYGTPITDWQNYTPTGTWTTNTTYQGKYRRVGDSIEGLVTVTLAGAPNAAALQFTIPSGLTVDTAKFNSALNYIPVGTGQGLDTSAGSLGFSFQSVYLSTTSIRALYQSAVTGSQGEVTQTSPITWASGDNLQFNYKVPISGWSSSVQMSDSADTRVLVFQKNNVNTATTYTSGSTSDITWLNASTVFSDTHGTWNGTVYTIPTAGYYKLTTQFVLNSLGYSAGSQYGIIWADAANTVIVDNPQFTKGSGTGRIEGGVTTPALFFNAGQTLKPRYFQGTGVNNSFQLVNIGIERVTGPSAIAATETIAASYWLSAVTAVTANVTDILFNSREFDTHGAWNTSTGRFTAPATGLYKVAVAYNVQGASNVRIYKNGSLYKLLGGADANNATGNSTLIQLISGDFITVRSSTSITVNGDANLSGGGSSIAIARIGL